MNLDDQPQDPKSRSSRSASQGREKENSLNFGFSKMKLNQSYQNELLGLSKISGQNSQSAPNYNQAQPDGTKTKSEKILEIIDDEYCQNQDGPSTDKMQVQTFQQLIVVESPNKQQSVDENTASFLSSSFNTSFSSKTSLPKI